MRNLGRKELARYDDVLHHACELIRSYSVHFKFHTTNIRTIPGQQEGLFVWTYLNYGHPDGQGGTRAVMEMGGASHQFAHKVQDDSVDPHVLSICTNRRGSPNRKEKVYARSWDDFGVDAYNNLFVEQLDNGINPCLPTGQEVEAKNGVKHIGEANFTLCREIATRIYNDAFEFPALPDLPTINRFEALSNYYHTYEFFSKRVGAGYIAADPYNATAFNAAVSEYCNESWDNVKEWVHTLPHTSDEFTQRHCLIAATLLHIFSNAPKSVSMKKSEPWTWGAAALIANHGGLKLCHDDEQELPLFLPPQPWLVGNGNLNVSLAQILPTFTPHAPQPATIVPAPSVPLWAYLSFAAALMFISRLLVQRSRVKTLGKFFLSDLENASGVKGDMKDLAGTVQGLEGLCKDRGRKSDKATCALRNGLLNPT